eukprot:TRINITY_DN3640_c0_g1_i1.p1 TRINITY_DN3640_c0_g1~~TRINITY_DN3640_c0_g1_i1.p1  ORF type:complete len:827 (+),score=88.35 TRINITY_DN3640_c0_g1_i1:1816-4296(+)
MIWTRTSSLIIKNSATWSQARKRQKQSLRPLTEGFLGQPKHQYRAKSLIETLKKKVNERGVKGLILLAKIFNLGDKGKVHNITLDEFKQAWREFKLGLDEADLEVIFREFDQDRDSLINSSEVFQAIKVSFEIRMIPQGNMNENRKRIVSIVFDLLDTNNSGKVNVSQIKAKYSPGKHPAVLEGRKIEKQVLDEFNTTLDSFLTTYSIGEQSHAMTKEEFEEFYSHISFTIDNDEYFTVMLRNSWNLDATAFASSLASPGKKVEERGKLGGESKESPFKKSISQAASEQPLIKPVQKIPVEAPYHTAEEEKKSGNVFEDKMLQKTDALVLNRFRNAILERGVRGVLGVERQFYVYAKDGFMELDDLKRAIHDFRIPVDPKDLTILFKAMDTDNDDKVHYSEFGKSVVGKMSPKRQQLVEQAFKVIDKDNDGTITKADLSRALDGLKHPDVKQGRKTQEDLLREITEILDIAVSLHVFFVNSVQQKPGGAAPGTYTKEDFETYYTYISACTESDASFEQLLSQLWKIDLTPKAGLEQSPYAGSSQKVYEVSGKEAYQKDIYGSMKNEEHPLKGSNKFEWDVPPYTVFEKVEEEKLQPAAGAPSFKEYKKREEDITDQEDMSNTELLDFVKENLKVKGVSGFIGLNKLLRRADRTKTGNISKDSLEDCLKQTGIKLSTRNRDKLFKLFDTTNSGQISHQEFFSTIVGEMSPSRTSLVEKAFHKLDRDKNGFIDTPDIVSAYNPSKHPDVVSKKKSPKQILAQFLDSLEAHLAMIVLLRKCYSKQKAGQKEQRITIDDFKDYYNLVSCTFENDEDFERALKEVWRMDQS